MTQSYRMKDSYTAGERELVTNEIVAGTFSYYYSSAVVVVNAVIVSCYYYGTT